MSCCFDLLRCLGLVSRNGYEHLSDGDSGTTGEDDDDVNAYGVQTAATASTRRSSKGGGASKKAKPKKKKPKKNTPKKKKKRTTSGEADDDDEDDNNNNNNNNDNDNIININNNDDEGVDASDDERFVVESDASDAAAASAAAHQLAAHVERLCRVGFDREFDALERQQDAAYRSEAFSVALAAGNVRKNRYSDILAHDHSRVALACSATAAATAATTNSDYINANWIAGGAAPRRFVSTQGPLESTFADFWRMLWEQNSRIVVMLTREVEKGVTKCDRYWPTAAIATYGAVRVNPCGVWRDASGQITLRRFRIAFGVDDDDVAAAAVVPHAGGAAWRDVYHFQYLGWPDHGVPETPGPFLTLLRDVSRIERQLLLHKVFPSAQHLPPLTVHCSAGIGRSGTFICVHAVLEELLVSLYDRTLCRRRALGGRRPPSIAARIARMRQQRFGMVQTRDQFRFCYTVVLEALQSRGFAAALRLHDDAARAAIEVLARLALGAEPAAAIVSPVDVLPIASAFERVVEKDEDDESSSVSSDLE